MVIFIDENIPHLNFALNKLASTFTFIGRTLKNKDLTDKNCNVLFVRSTTKINEELMRNTDIKFVGTVTSGIDHIDLDYLNLNDIKFANAPGSNSNSVAEYVIYSILKWHFEKKVFLKGKTIGIIGYGNIGRKVAYYSKILGLNILVNDPPLKENNYKFPEYVEYKELHELIQQSDITTNHVPLTLSGKYPTKFLLNRENLSLLKNEVLFIHSSRGGVVDEFALLDILPLKNITLCIDVWETEPIINRQLTRQCLIATPHIAGYSRNGKLNGSMMMLKSFEKFFELQPDYTLINNEFKKLKPEEDYKIQSENQDYSFDLKKLYFALKRNRAFELDSEQLKQSLNLDEKQRARKFDFFRKNYPVRKETLIYDEEI